MKLSGTLIISWLERKTYQSRNLQTCRSITLTVMSIQRGFYCSYMHHSMENAELFFNWFLSSVTNSRPLYQILFLLALHSSSSKLPFFTLPLPLPRCPSLYILERKWTIYDQVLISLRRRRVGPCLKRMSMFVCRPKSLEYKIGEEIQRCRVFIFLVMSLVSNDVFKHWLSNQWPNHILFVYSGSMWPILRKLQSLVYQT